MDSWVCINSPISGTCYPNGVPFSFLPDLPCLHQRVGFGEVLGAPRMMGQYGLDLGPVCLLICASTCFQGRQGTIPLWPSGTLPKPCKGDPCSCLSSWEFWALPLTATTALSPEPSRAPASSQVPSSPSRISQSVVSDHLEPDYWSIQSSQCSLFTHSLTGL